MNDDETKFLAVSDLVAIDRACEQFENEYQQGNRPTIASYLADTRGIEDLLQLAIQLISIEAEYRRNAGEKVSASDYADLEAAYFAEQEFGREVNNAIADKGGEFEALPNQVDAIGNYELIEVIGQGGMGVVFLARHNKFRNRRYAIKLLKSGQYSDDAILRFEREIQATGNLEHPNIVFAEDAGTTLSADGNEHPYLVMEFVNGTDVSKIVKHESKLEIADACEIILQAALGLQHAHERQLTHRDIKPANLMLSTDGVVKLLDLGLARLAGESSVELTVDGQILGTADYMPPEQWSNSSDVDIRADIYSLGCSLFCLLTGQPPFGESHKTLSTKMHAHLKEQPPLVSRMLPEIPGEISELLSKCLQKDPNKRFSCPAELAEQLKPFSKSGDLQSLIARQPNRKDRSQENVGTVSLADALAQTATVSPRRSPGIVARNTESMRTAKKYWWQIGTACIIAMALIATAIFSSAFSGAASKNESNSNASNDSAQASSQMISSVKLWRLQETESAIKDMGFLGEHVSAEDYYVGDSAKVVVELANPAFLACIAFESGPKATSYPFYPLNPSGEKLESGKWKLPLENRIQFDQTGQHVFMIIASEKPIGNVDAKSYEWLGNHDAGNWFFDGKIIEPFYKDRRRVRGMKNETPKQVQELVTHFKNLFPECEIRAFAVNVTEAENSP